MKIYVFGNEDTNFDNKALIIADKLRQEFEVIEIKPNQDLPFAYKENLIILDTVLGLETPQVIDEKKLISTKSTTVHDFDLGFQLKYLRKLGKLGRVWILGIPMDKDPDYDSIQSILRKLVAQDIQGS